MKLSNDARPAEKKRILIISNPFLFHVIQFKFPPLPMMENMVLFKLPLLLLIFIFRAKKVWQKSHLSPFKCRFFVHFLPFNKGRNLSNKNLWFPASLSFHDIFAKTIIITAQCALENTRSHHKCLDNHNSCTTCTVLVHTSYYILESHGYRNVKSFQMEERSSRHCVFLVEIISIILCLFPLKPLRYNSRKKKLEIQKKLSYSYHTFFIKNRHVCSFISALYQLSYHNQNQLITRVLLGAR